MARADLMVTADQRLEVREMRLSLASQEVRVRWWVCSTCYIPDYLLSLWHLLADTLSLQVSRSLGLQLEAALRHVVTTGLQDCNLDLMTASC